MKRMTIVAALVALVALVACDPYDNYCNKMQQCTDDGEDGYDAVGIGSDYHEQCVAELKGGERTLRANSEPECQVAADAYKNLIGCEAFLDCQDIRKEDLGGNCKDELAARDKANKDASDECQSGVVSCASTSAPAPLAALLVVLAWRRRRPPG